jgi:capsular exopolysaccharide synthesis family protein
MSRIFDALQRSVAEESGVEFPDFASIVERLVEVSPSSIAAESRTQDQKRESAADDARVTAAFTEAGATETPLEFPSVEVSLPPVSRLVFLTEPDRLPAEKFRFLSVRLRHLRQNRPLKKILITSTIPEEGKSLVSANLAGMLARRKQKVLLIEGDLRRPGLTQQFGLGKIAGLGEWLQNGLQTCSNVYYLCGANFWLMPAGHTPANPLELMQSGKLPQLMRQLDPSFDWIIVDSPPLLPLADTSIWARLTDGILLVAREGKTEKASF